MCPGEGYSPRTHYSEAPVTVWKCGLINKIMCVREMATLLTVWKCGLINKIMRYSGPEPDVMRPVFAECGSMLRITPIAAHLAADV